jgi:hypothetical protein
MRLLAPGAVEHDEAEQLLLAQFLLLQYGRHPPLYTWLQHGAFQLLGVGVLGLAVLKHACLLGIFASTYVAARRIQGDAGRATLTTLALWLMPPVVWEAPRDLTHSVLAAALAPPAVQLLVGLADRPTAWRYAALGAVLGLGFLAKYNFGLFAAILLGAALSVPAFRPALLDRRIGLTVLLAAAVVGPHVAALGLGPAPTAAVGALGVGQGSAVGPERRLGDVALDVAAVLGPLLLVVGILLPGVRRPAPEPEARRRAVRQLLERYLVGLLAILALGVPLLGLPAFKARWLLPLLVVTPLALFLRVPVGAPTRSVRRLAGVCGAAALLALALRLGEVQAGPILGHASRLHLPIADLAAGIRAAGFRQGIIIAGDNPLGGNLRLHFPDTLVLTPRLADVAPAAAPRAPGQCLVAWRPRDDGAPPPWLLDLASERFGRPPPAPDSGVLVEVPLRDPAARPYGLGLIAIPAGPAPCERAVALPTAPRPGEPAAPGAREAARQ